METVFNKTIKISAICLIVTLLISIVNPIFAANSLSLSSINVGDKLKFTGFAWCVYKTESAAKNLNKLKVKRYLKTNEQIVVKAKNGVVLKIANDEFIYYSNLAKSNFKKISSGTTTTTTNNTGNTNKNIKYYTVKFNANGGKGSMSDQKITYNVETALSANLFTRSGYKFKGWHAYRSDEKKWIAVNKKDKSDTKWMTKSDIEKSSTYTYYLYPNKQKVKTTIAAGKTVTMYAQWEKASGVVTTNEYTYKHTNGVTYTTAIKGTKLKSVLGTISSKGISQKAYYSKLGGECFKVAKYHTALLTGKLAESNANKDKVLSYSITETSHKHYTNAAGLYKRIKSLIDNKKPAVIYVTSSTGSQHWVTVVGYTGDANSFGKFLILDSYSGALTTGGNGNACSLRKHAYDWKITGLCARTFN